MLLTPIKVARGALLRFCRICERREGPGSGLGISKGFESVGHGFGVCLVLCTQRSAPFIRSRILHLLNMDEGDTLVRRRSRRSTAGNR